MAGWYRGNSPFLRSNGRPGFSRLPGGRLLVGEYPQPDDAAWMRAEQAVDAVLCLQDDDDFASKRLDPGGMLRAYLDHGIEFHRVPVVDGDSEHLAARLHEIVDLLHRLLADGRRVYLHCNAGFNRAPTVAIAYLHVHGGLGLEEAERVVKAHRPCVPYRRALELAFRPAR
ncbi:dual specificity protein phosphatase family protein [bacterium]|nr:dual specificity protein phosphatase family protein [bacterium]